MISTYVQSYKILHLGVGQVFLYIVAETMTTSLIPHCQSNQVGLAMELNFAHRAGLRMASEAVIRIVPAKRTPDPCHPSRALSFLYLSSQTLQPWWVSVTKRLS